MSIFNSSKIRRAENVSMVHERLNTAIKLKCLGKLGIMRARTRTFTEYNVKSNCLHHNSVDRNNKHSKEEKKKTDDEEYTV